MVVLAPEKASDQTEEGDEGEGGEEVMVFSRLPISWWIMLFCSFSKIKKTIGRRALKNNKKREKRNSLKKRRYKKRREKKRREKKRREKKRKEKKGYKDGLWYMSARMGRSVAPRSYAWSRPCAWMWWKEGWYAS